MATEDEKRLGAADTTHDTFPGWRNEQKSDAETAELKSYLAGLFGRIGYPDLWRSGVEEYIIDAFESDSKIASVSATITYNEILRGNGSVPADIQTSNSIVISPDTGFDIDMASPADRLKIANFILAYQFGTSEGYTPYYTFDAGAAMIGKIFRNHPAARGLITPQNIADSAVTSFGQLGQRPNLYAFPTTAGGNFVSRRNYFTADTFSVQYVNSGFTENTPYGFTHDIVSGANKVSSRFAPGQQQGPSIDYLLNLLMAAAAGGSLDSRSVPLPSNCLRLGDNIEAIPAIAALVKRNPEFFLDVKREGDEDQGDAADIMNGELKYVTQVTGDRLLATFMKLLQRRSIYQYHQTLTITRGQEPMPNLSPEAQRAWRAAFEAEQSKSYVDKNRVLYETLVSPAFISALKEWFDADAPIDGKAFVPGVLELFGFKKNDMQQTCVDIIKVLEGVAKPIVISAEAIKLVFDEFESVKIDRDDLLGLISAVKSPFNFNSEYPILLYSPKTFKALNSAIIALRAKITGRPDRYVVNYFELANVKDGYNSSLKEILNSFLPDNDDVEPFREQPISSNKTTRESIRGIIMPWFSQGGGDDERANFVRKGRAGNIEALSMQSSRVPRTIIRPRKKIRPQPDLFREICAVAALYVRSNFGIFFPNIEKLSALNMLAYERGVDPVSAGVAAAAAAPLVVGLVDAAALISAADEEALRWPAAFFQADGTPYPHLLQKLEEILIIWRVQSDSSAMITTMLDPYGDGGLKEGHPFSPVQTSAIQDKYIPQLYAYPEVVAIVTLALMNDILEGAVGRATSVFSRLIVQGGGLPAYLAGYDITSAAGWGRLDTVIRNIVVSIGLGGVKQALLSLAGGSRYRNTRRKHRNKKNRKTKRR